MTAERLLSLADKGRETLPAGRGHVPSTGQVAGWLDFSPFSAGEAGGPSLWKHRVVYPESV